jgi:hypothetical protein
MKCCQNCGATPLPPRHTRYCDFCSRIASTLGKRAERARQRTLPKPDVPSWQLKGWKSHDAQKRHHREYMQKWRLLRRGGTLVVLLLLLAPAALRADSLRELRFVFGGGKQHAVSHAAGNTIVFQRTPETSGFVAPVSVTINGAPAAADLVSSAQLRVTSVTDLISDGASANVTIINGDERHFSIDVVRSGDSIRAIAPQATFSAASGIPATRVRFQASGVAADERANVVRMKLPDDRQLALPARRTGDGEYEFAVPMIPGTTNTLFSGGTTVSFETAPGIPSGTASFAIGELPQAAGQTGDVTLQFIARAREIADTLADTTTAQLIANGAPADEVRLVRELPYAQFQWTESLVRDALNGTPQTLVIPSAGGTRTVIIDRDAVALLDRILTASGTLATLGSAHAQATALATAAACGPTREEAKMIAAAQLYDDLDHVTEVTAAAALLASAASLSPAAPVSIPAAGLLAVLDVGIFAEQIWVGINPLQFDGMIFGEPKIELTAGDPATSIDVRGRFIPIAYGASVKEAAQKFVELFLESVLKRIHLSWLPKDVIHELTSQLLGAALDKLVSKFDVRLDRALADSAAVPLSAATTKVNTSAANGYLGVDALCGGSLTVRPLAPTPPASMALLLTPAFPLMSPGRSGTYVLPFAVRSAPIVLPAAHFTMSAAGKTARNGETLDVNVSSGTKAAVTAVAESLAQADSVEWLLDGARIAASRTLNANIGVGKHVLTLKVTNAQGASASAAGGIEVSALPAKPAAAFRMSAGENEAVDGHTLTVTTPEGQNTMVLFSGVRSFDPLGRTLAFAWTLNGQSVSSEREFKRDLGAGTYAVALTVRAPDGASDSATGSIRINAAASSGPWIDRITPASAPAGDIPLVVDGRNFDPAARIVFDGPSCKPCVDVPDTRSATRLEAKVALNDAGTYSVSVLNGSAAKSNAVTLTVVSAPSTALTATPPSLTFDLHPGSGSRSASVTIASSGGGALPFTATPKEGWISVPLPSGTTPSSLTVNVDPSSLGAGSFDGTVEVASSSSRLRIPVHVNVSDAPRIEVQPSSWPVAFTLGEGSATLPLKITNVLAGTLLGTATVDAEWLRLNGHASTSWVAPESLSMTADPSGLAAGTYNATVTITSPDATNSPFNIPVTMTIYTPLQVLTSALPELIYGNAYRAELAASGGSGGYLWRLDNGSLPSGLTLNAQSGVISGTPSNGPDVIPITIVVNDSYGHSRSRDFTIRARTTVSIGSMSPTVNAFILRAVYTKSGSGCFAASGGTPPYTWSSSGMPPGLTVESGCVIGQPTQVGSFDATITATDSTGLHGSVPHTFLVTTNPLKITERSIPPATLNVAYGSLFISATGGDSATYQWSTDGALPDGLSAKNSPGCPSSCSLEISGTPTRTGSFTFAVIVKDSLNNAARQNVTIVVNSGTPPAIDSGKLPRALVGSPYTYQLQASGGSGAPYTWSVVGGALDAGLALSSAGVLSGATTAGNDCNGGALDGTGGGWIDSAHPAKTFTARVTDSAGQSITKNLCAVSYFPRAQITGVSPGVTIVDGSAHVITVSGSNFRGGAELKLAVNGFPYMGLDATVQSPTQLTFTLYPQRNNYPFSTNAAGSNIVGFGTWPVILVQWYSENSNFDQAFSVFAPPPVVSSAQALDAETKASCTIRRNCEIQLNGSGFDQFTSYEVLETGQKPIINSFPPGLATWSQVTVQLVSFSTPGTYTIRVTNAHQQGGSPVSVTGTFTVAGLP